MCMVLCMILKPNGMECNVRCLVSGCSSSTERINDRCMKHTDKYLILVVLPCAAPESIMRGSLDFIVLLIIVRVYPPPYIHGILLVRVCCYLCLYSVAEC